MPEILGSLQKSAAPTKPEGLIPDSESRSADWEPMSIYFSLSPNALPSTLMF